MLRQRKQKFIGRFRHELRTRMNAIMGMTELCLETDLTPEQREMIRAIQDSSSVLYHMVETLIEMVTASDTQRAGARSDHEAAAVPARRSTS
ncbi:MAG TPA: histidine kinase dimerization/phospho-acceptor domain-containing protein [Gemmatimonadaceae bacterium]|nr:histidine kinase dimerization/phospho-acceptor domain-containing protein [Gemmatimonadaceae bacterium]